MKGRMGVARNFSKGGGASHIFFQNFQGSPLGNIFRSHVIKITKGPPLVKIFVKILTKNMCVFLYRKRSEPNKFGILS